MQFDELKKSGNQSTEETTNGELNREVDYFAVRLNDETQDILLDNVLCYIAGYIVKELLAKLTCTKCHAELLLDAGDPHGYRCETYPPDCVLTLHKQRGGLLFPSPAVLKIVKTSESAFKHTVIGSASGITSEKNLETQLKRDVLQEVGIGVFRNIEDHFADHTIGESDHLTSLLRLTVAKYLNIRLKTYGTTYSEMIAHRNIPSSRHCLTKQVIFSGQ